MKWALKDNALLVLLAILCAVLVAACASAPPPMMDNYASSAPAAGGGQAEQMREMVQAQEGSAVSDGATTTPQRRMIARATLDLVVSDTQAAVDSITQLMESLDGYISNANLYKNSYGGAEMLQGSMTLRVPADQLESALEQLEALAITVRGRTVNREDVTEQYSDIDAQLRNLQATENELREMLAEVRAKPNAKPEDILAVHRELTAIRSQIEQLQGRKNVLDNQIGLSTIDLSLMPDALNQPVVEEGWRPGVILRSALRALVSTLQWLASAAIWIVVYVLPILVLVLLPFVVLFLIVRAVVRRQRRKRAAQATPASS